jgi:hypothetical protein
LLILYFYVMFLCFVCLRLVSCVPNVASVIELSILYCPFGFLLPMSLDYSFLTAPSVFSNIYLSRFLCAQCCQCLWIVHSWLPLRFSQMFIYKNWSCLCHQTVIGIKVLLIKIHCIFEYYTRDYIHVLIIRHIYWTICENFTYNFCLYSQTQRKSTSVLLYRCYFKMSSVIRYFFVLPYRSQTTVWILRYDEFHCGIELFMHNIHRVPMNVSS